MLLRQHDSSSRQHKRLMIYIVCIFLLIAMSALFLFGLNKFNNIQTLPEFTDSRTEDQKNIVEVPAVEDVSVAITPELIESHTKLLYGAFASSSSQESVPAETTDVVPSLVTWNTPHPDATFAEGDDVTVSGSYTLPKNWIGVITVYKDAYPVAYRFIDQRNTDMTTGAYEIKLPQYHKGKQTYSLTLDAAASCRMACAPEDDACMKTSTNFCGLDSSLQAHKVYEGRTLGITDHFTEATCQKKTFSSGPRDESAPNSCMEGFKTPFYLTALTYLQLFTLSSSTLEAFTTDVHAYYGSIQNGSPEKVEGSKEGVFWRLEYISGGEDGKACVGSVALAVNCPTSSL